MPGLVARRGANIPNPDRRLFPSSLLLTTYQPWAEGFSTATPTTYSPQASASTNTKGAWLELDNSTEGDIYALELSVTTDTAQVNSNTAALLDIGIGGSGSEVVIVPDIQAGFYPKGVALLIPVFIPSGTRVAARVASAIASRFYNFRVRPRTAPHGLKPAKYCTTYGANASLSKGVTVAAPGAANTKGAWTQVTATTTERLAAMLVCFSGNGTSSFSSPSFLADVGVGGAGSEVVVVPDIFSTYTTNEVIYTYGAPRLYSCDIPAGSRIAARYQTTSVTTGVDCLIVGVPWRR